MGAPPPGGDINENRKNAMGPDKQTTHPDPEIKGGVGWGERSKKDLFGPSGLSLVLKIGGGGCPGFVQRFPDVFKIQSSSTGGKNGNKRDKTIKVSRKYSSRSKPKWSISFDF